MKLRPILTDPIQLYCGSSSTYILKCKTYGFSCEGFSILFNYNYLSITITITIIITFI